MIGARRARERRSSRRAYLRHALARWFGARRARTVLRAYSVRVLGACCWRCRWPATSARPGCWSRRRPPPRRCSSGFSGRPRALEAGWKYLILTSLGLGVALLGIVLLASAAPGGDLGRSRWRALSPTCRARARDRARRLRAAARRPRGQDRLGAGAQLAARRPLRGAAARLARCSPPRSCRRCCSSPGASSRRSRPRSAPTRRGELLIGFGLVSLAVAVPFLWRPLAWKRLLAYSSLEHMGVIALGIGFATPLALAGVAVHIAGHAIAKALGFYAAMPLLGHEPRAAGHAVTGVARTQPRARRGDGRLARRARRAAAVAAVRQRGADRRRRLRGGHARGRRRRRRSCSRSASSASRTR